MDKADSAAQGIASSIELKVIDEHVPKSLHELLQALDAPMPLEKVIAVAIEICDALIVRGMPHCDLNPHILLICEDGAAMIDDSRGGWLNETRSYQAPETRKDPPRYTSAADVYSIGIVLKEMLAAHQSAEAPERLRKIISKCTQKDPKSRYKTVEELRSALQKTDDLALVPPATSDRGCFRVGAAGWSWALSLLFLAFVAYGFRTPPVGSTLPATAPAPGQIIDVQAEAPPHEYKDLDSKELALLSKYDYVFLLDRSGSMTAADCSQPGKSPGVYSRWSWASRELESFAKLADKALPSGFTVITFNDGLKRYDNRNRSDLEQIYHESGPDGGTAMSEPFREAMNDQGKSSKPLAVVILSDGQPADGAAVQNDVIAATQGPEKLHVEFLTLGRSDPSLVTELDNQLVERGASYDAVHSETFEELATDGIAHSLAKALAAEEEKK